MICASCGAEVPGSPKFCNKCGKPFVAAAAAAPPAAGATKVCPQCGTVNPAAAKFCKKDGFNFDKAPAPAPAKPQAAPPPPPPPKPAAPVAPPPRPAAPPASQAAIPGSVTCPTCGTVNPPNAKFCKKDGTALGAAAAPAPRAPTPAPAPAAAPPPPPPPPKPAAPKEFELSLVEEPEEVEEEPEPAPKPMAPPPAPPRSVSQPIEAKPRIEIPKPAPAQPSIDETGIHATGLHKRPRSKAAMISVIVGALVLAGGAAGFLYWKGILGNRPDSVAQTIVDTLREKGFDGITVSIGPDWTATVGGTVVGQVKRDELLGIVQQNANVKGVTDNLIVRPGPGELEQQVSDALTARGLKDVTVSVGNDLVAMLKGTVDDPALETVAVDTARSVNGLKDVQSAIKLSLPARQAALAAALAAGGYDQVQAQIVDDNTVNVTGNVYSADEKTKLVEIVTSTAGAATVNDSTQIVERPPVIDAGKVEADINKQLKAAGLANVVTAVVDEQLNATLVGTVSKAADRDKAMKAARKVTTAKSVRSEIELASAAPPPPAAPIGESGAIALAKGQWVGKINAGFLSTFPFVIIINGGAMNQDVGTSMYGSGKGVCAGTLTLTNVDGSVFTFNESITRNGFNCPGGGIMKMQMTPDGKANYEWYRAKTPNKRAATGVGVKH